MKFAVLLYISSGYLSTFCNKNEDFVTEIQVSCLKKSMSPDGGVGGGVGVGGSWNMLKNVRERKRQ